MSVRNSIRDAIRSAIGLVEEVFNPQTLFLSGEQGVWYDPSDTTTLFQDSAGTTPVTASGQPVGLMLDKSKGLVRTPGGLLNTNFSTASNWNLGLNWTISGGKAVASGATTGLIYQPITRPAVYEVDVIIDSVSGGGVQFYDGLDYSTTISAAGTYRFLVGNRNQSYGFFSIRCLSGVSAVIDSVSFTKVEGNHATQPTAGSHPIYRRGDSRGVVNLLTWSEDFSNAAWAKGTDSTAIPNTTLAPDGSMTGDTYQNTGNNREFSQTYLTPTPEGGTFTASISIKPGTLTTFGYKIRRGDTSDGITVNDIQISSGTPEPNGFYRHKLTHTFSGSTTGDNVVVLFGANFGATGNMVIHGAQLNLGPTALPYQRNDSRLGGVATGASTDLHWLETDGVDDGMATGNIDFTGTDKVSVFAGVRKLSDAAVGVMAELSVAAGGVNVGSLYLVGSSPSGVYQYRIAGTLVSTLNSATYPAPHSSVQTLIGDIPADNTTARVNGSVSSVATDLGAGNFGNYPLYLFRRGGTSLPFNGWFYGLAITGRLTTDAETVATERFLAAKSAVVIP